MELLGLAAMVIEVAYRDDRDDDRKRPPDDGLVEASSELPIPGPRRFAVLAGNSISGTRCAAGAAGRWPPAATTCRAWLTGLSDLTIERVVRMTHVLRRRRRIAHRVTAVGRRKAADVRGVRRPQLLLFITDAFFVPTTVDDELVDLASRE